MSSKRHQRRKQCAGKRRFATPQETQAVEPYVADLVEAGDPVPVDAGQGTIELETPGVLVNV